MGLFNKNGGLMDEIRCDEQNYLIWKWHPAGTMLGESKKENAIRWGSSLRVKEGSVAVFVYKRKYEVYQDYIYGPCDQVLQTANLPVLASIIGAAYDGGTPFQAEVYFINLAKIIQVKFGVPFFDVYDPRFLDYGVPTAVRGTISFRIEDYKEFVSLHRLDNFDLNDFEKQIRDAVIRYVKNVVANAPTDYNIPVLQIERKIAQINELVERDIKNRFKEDFGVVVSGVDISAVEIDKNTEGYRQLKKVTQDVTTDTVQAQTDVNIKNMQDMQRIQAENLEETLRMQREEMQYAQRKQTQTTNFAAYQVESQTEVGVAGANALGQMGATNAGGMSDGGFNPAAMMAGMAMGSAMGQNLAGTMNTMMSGINQPVQQPMTPPPVPAVLYNVAVNGQATGPYDLATLKQMVINGQFNAYSLVWTTGMPDWIQAGMVEDLKGLF